MRRMKQGFVPCKVDFPVGENAHRAKGARAGADKPKNTENSQFQAGSDYSLSASHRRVELVAPYT